MKQLPAFDDVAVLLQIDQDNTEIAREMLDEFAKADNLTDQDLIRLNILRARMLLYTTDEENRKKALDDLLGLVELCEQNDLEVELLDCYAFLAELLKTNNFVFEKDVDGIPEMVSKLSVKLNNCESLTSRQYNYRKALYSLIHGWYFRGRTEEQLISFVDAMDYITKLVDPYGIFYNAVDMITQIYTYEQEHLQIKILKMYLKYAEEENFPDLALELLISLKIKIGLYNHEKRLDYSKKGLKYAKQIDDKKKIAQIQFDIGKENYELKNYDESRNALLQYLHSNEEYQDERKLVQTKYLLGKIEKEKNNLVKAKDWFNSAVEMNVKKAYHTSKAQEELAEIAKLEGDKGQEFQQRCNSFISEITGPNWAFCSNENNMRNSLFENKLEELVSYGVSIGKKDETIDFLLESIPITRSMPSISRLEASMSEHLGKLVENDEEAYGFLEKSLERYTEIGNEKEQIKLRHMLGNKYFERDEDEALRFYKTAFSQYQNWLMSNHFMSNLLNYIELVDTENYGHWVIENIPLEKCSDLSKYALESWYTYHHASRLLEKGEDEQAYRLLEEAINEVEDQSDDEDPSDLHVRYHIEWSLGMLDMKYGHSSTAWDRIRGVIGNIVEITQKQTNHRWIYDSTRNRKNWKNFLYGDGDKSTIFEQIDPDQIARKHFTVGLIYLRDREYQLAQDHLLEVLSRKENLKEERKTFAQVAVGMINKIGGNYSEAYNHFSKINNASRLKFDNNFINRNMKELELILDN